MTQQWTLRDIPDLSGRLALVTGANRGLGLEIAAGLAGAGARVVLGCRNLARAEAAVAEIQRRAPRAQTEVMAIDLADLASVRDFAAGFTARHEKLDLLVNNGAAIMVPKGRTRDGFETHMGTNHLGPFLLTGLLLDRLAATPGARILNTASMAHGLTSGVNLEDPLYERRPYKEMDAYGASKLATLQFTFELDRRLRRAGLPVTALAAHPGYTATNLDIGNAFMRLMTRLIAQAPAMGALPALYAATAPGVSGGEYYGPDGFKELKGYPRKVGCKPDASDPVKAARLWGWSEQMTGMRYLQG
ncbi:SDR family NAD(P)-dependent oxidoreductase [Solimonas sp. K1W22B-7]|uniref:oxidoreductase n=1 Tax=Solimonas sp. K1W22B-7 TaxID=2303331 RepID=UPI000E332A1A|nr:oxidoreductase [Solimonas sp. K1W22B-7]AXQ28640.1 SDR family NAD(P)-dependent oxidoreductase [Solimonas sp. K1W22B-7]